jgi:rhomboid protease GluP
VPLPVRWRYKIDRWRTQLAGMFRSEPKQLRPRLCPSCGTLVGATATKCHQCGASMRFSFGAANKTLERLMPTTSPVTYAMLTICCVMYVLSLVITMKFQGFGAPQGGLLNLGGISNRINYRLGATIPFPFVLTEPWRIVTAIFLHGSLLHIGFNMYALMYIGPMVEELYGSAKYFFLYIATGVAGYIVSSFIGYQSVGASGAVMGLIGVMLAATSGRKNFAAQSIRSTLILWVVFTAFMGFRPGSGTDNAAHFGGLAAGYALGRLMPDRQPADLSERKQADLMGWVTGIVVVICFGFMVVNYLQNTEASRILHRNDPAIIAHASAGRPRSSNEIPRTPSAPQPRSRG